MKEEVTGAMKHKVLEAFEDTLDGTEHAPVDIRISVNNVGWTILECGHCTAAWIAYTHKPAPGEFTLGRGRVCFEQVEGPQDCTTEAE